MSMPAAGRRHHTNTVDDLADWVRSLSGGPIVTLTVPAACRHPFHGDEPATWFYVEADAEAGVARIRCLSGAHQTDVVDSADHWTYPPMWACSSCRQSLAEVVYGVHDEDGLATWLVVAVRCVGCGDAKGLTDIVLSPVPIADLLATF